MPKLPEVSLAAAELRSRFHDLRTRQDLAAMLEVPLGYLNRILYGTGPDHFYRTWEIKKRSGGTRQISAPFSGLYILQNRLNRALQAVYTPRRSVHGFMQGRSVVTNASPHTGRRWVFNCDIEDFFRSINFGRVRGVFMARPFHAGEEAATAMAQIACYDGALPIGGATSPVISNMIAMRLDRELMQLARSEKVWYTRYADDMTFSSDRNVVPDSIAVFDSRSKGFNAGDVLTSIVNSNGFQINPQKSRLQRPNERQLVTGLVVNQFVNVDRRYVRNLRAMIHSVEALGLVGAQEKFDRSDSRDRYPGADPAILDVIRGKLAYLTMVRGSDDLLAVRTRMQFDNVVAGRPRLQGLVAEPAHSERQRGHVFISYMTEDSQSVLRLERELKDSGLDVWRDAQRLWPGDEWKRSIRDAIREDALAFVPCFSTRTVAKGHSFMFEELIIAIEEFRMTNPDRTWFFPTFLEKVKPPSYNLGLGRTIDDLQRTELWEDWNAEVGRLITSLQRCLI